MRLPETQARSSVADEEELLEEFKQLKADIQAHGIHDVPDPARLGGR